MMLNRIVLIGRLTKDPEFRFTQNGTPLATFTLAVDRPGRDEEGKHETDFIPVQCWGALAEAVSDYTRKGSQVGVTGRLQIRTYETQEGQKRKAAVVVADGVEFLGNKRKEEAGEAEQ